MVDTLTMHKEPERKPKNWKMAAVWGVMLALLAGNVFAVWKTVQIQGSMEQMESAYQQQVTGLEERARDLTVRADTHEVMLRSELKKTQEAARTAAGKASQQAGRQTELALSKLATEYRQKQALTIDELQQLKGAAQQNGEAVFKVQTDVENVRGDVASAKAELASGLDAARTELTSVKGDLGVQSGLIATNAQELATLRKLGEREYHEFTIPKNKRTYKIGNVAMELKKTKPKQGRFTIDVIADDLRVEKKNRTVNEPVQFYLSGSRSPYEIVVNEVKKDRIVGYLAVPKMLRAAR